MVYSPLSKVSNESFIVFSIKSAYCKDLWIKGKSQGFICESWLYVETFPVIAIGENAAHTIGCYAEA